MPATRPDDRAVHVGPADLAAAVAQHVQATNAAHAAREASSMANYYATGLHGIDPDLAAHRVREQRLKAVHASEREAASLRALNLVLRVAGVRTGETAMVGRHVYRATSEGQMAVHLGVELPADCWPEEEVSRSDEVADLRRDYHQATRFEG